MRQIAATQLVVVLALRALARPFGSGDVEFTGEIAQCSSITVSVRGFDTLVFPVTVAGVQDDSLLGGVVGKTGLATAQEVAGASVSITLSTEAASASLTLAIPRGTHLDWAIVGADGVGEWGGFRSTVERGRATCLPGGVEEEEASSSYSLPPATSTAPPSQVSNATVALPPSSLSGVANITASLSQPSVSSSSRTSRSSSVPSEPTNTSSQVRRTTTVDGQIVTVLSYAVELPAAPSGKVAADPDKSLTDTPKDKSDGKTTAVVLSALGGTAALIIALVIAIRCFFTRRAKSKRLSATSDWSDRFFAPKPSTTVDLYNPPPLERPRSQPASDVFMLETAERGAAATRLNEPF